MKYYIVAGEASGDLHGSNLVRALRQADPQAQIRAWGGDRMQQEGASLVRHYRDLAFMGFVEVAANLRTILGNLRFCKRDIEAFAPDAVILIDYPGFNLRIASWCREKGYKTFYYISPQVWAWKEGRVKSIRSNVDHMLVILPFEQEFYRRHRYPVDYVGHPLLDALARRTAPDAADFRRRQGLDERPIVALLPGSRVQEIRAMLPVMAQMAGAFPDYQFVVAATPVQPARLYDTILGNSEVKRVTDCTYDLLSVSHAALVTSGTATLETALIGVPQVVCYKGSPLSYFIGRMVVKVPFISLVNLIASREVVRELIQGAMNPQTLAQELRRILSGPTREKMLADYAEIRHLLGDGGASRRAAEAIVSRLRAQHPAG